MSLRNRLLVTLALIALSVFYLVPRDITIRERDLASGTIRDTVVKRVPLKLGLDLQGGMHLALELDQSKQVSSDPKRDLDLALTVLRKRVDEFGVSEPVTQMVGDDRIVVELPGIDDPARAKAIVQRSAFLEFRITNETNALEKAIPAMDRVLRGLGIRGPAPPAGKPSAVEQLLGGDSASKKAGADSASRTGSADSAAGDTAGVAPADAGGGVLAGLIQPSGAAGGAAPGEYMVPETAYPRVDSLLSVAAVARQLPRGVTLRWAATPTRGGGGSDRLLEPLGDGAIINGSHVGGGPAPVDALTHGPLGAFELVRRGGRPVGGVTGRHGGG
jgi:hypothetical protein